MNRDEAELDYTSGKYEQAEPLLQRALAIHEQELGPNHPETATSLNNLAGLYQAQGKYKLAEPLMHRALQIRVHSLGLSHPKTIITRENYATLLDVSKATSEQMDYLFHANSPFVGRGGIRVIYCPKCRQERPFQRSVWDGSLVCDKCGYRTK